MPTKRLALNVGLLLLLFGNSGRAEDYIYVTNNGAITIGKYQGGGGAVEIPEMVYGMPVTKIGDYAFFASGLLSLAVPGSVEEIGEYAFGYCSGLTNLVLPEGLSSVGANAFFYCSNLAEVGISATVSRIGDQAFYRCGSLTTIQVAPFNPTFSSVDGVLFDKARATLLRYPQGRVGSYTIPPGVSTVGAAAFSGSEYMWLVSIPESVTRIMPLAFSDCTYLGSVTIPNGVSRIEDQVFYNCNYLVEVSIPASVTTIGDYAFYACAVYSLNLPGVQRIGQYAFGWNLLGSVTIGSAVKSIEATAFYNCNHLWGFYFLGDAPQFDGAFSRSLNSLEVYYLPGTAGWGSTFGGRPTMPWRLPNPTILTLNSSLGVRTNSFGFTISWATNADVVVEATANLASPDWVPLATNTLVQGSSYFSDTGWENHSQRLYRVRQR